MKKIIILGFSLFSFNLFAQDYVYNGVNQVQATIGINKDNGTYSSCKEILDSGNSVGDGVYEIKVSNKKIDVYCDMTTSGGGWTMVVAQFESNVADWGEGIQDDYDPSLNSSTGFSLNDAEIPNHTQVSFGKQYDPTFIDYINYQYVASGVIKPIRLVGQKNSVAFDLARSTLADGVWYLYGDPEYPRSNFLNKNYYNILTFDRTNLIGRTWIFNTSWKTEDIEKRGNSMNGVHLINTREYYAWTVWVR